jgi:hypothetical protein
MIHDVATAQSQNGAQSPTNDPFPLPSKIRHKNQNTVLTMATSTPLIVADPTKGTKVDAGIVAKSFRDEIKAKVAELKTQGIGE